MLPLEVFEKDLSDYRKVHGKIDHILVCGDIAYKVLKRSMIKPAFFLNNYAILWGVNRKKYILFQETTIKIFILPMQK